MCIKIEPIIIASIVLSMNTTTSSHNFIGNFADIITTIVSAKNIICEIETETTKNLACGSSTGTFSAINSTGKNISAIPTGKLAAMSAALGTLNRFRSGTKSLPKNVNIGVFSASIKAPVPIAQSEVTTFGITSTLSLRLDLISPASGGAKKAF